MSIVQLFGGKKHILAWWALIAIHILTINIGFAEEVIDQEAELIRTTARDDAIYDFQYKPWLLKWGGCEFGALFLVVGSDFVPEYPYRSKFLEFSVIAGVPSFLAYKRQVPIPIKRSNQIQMRSGDYQTIYLAEYQAAVKQLRVVNTFIGTGFYAITLLLVKSILQ